MAETGPYRQVVVDGHPMRRVRPAFFARRELSVRYGTLSPTQTLDVYLPDGPSPYPVIVSIHGGAFAFGDSRGPDCVAALNGLARGYAVVSVNYRLSGEAPFPADVEDVKAAIRWTRANAPAYGFDPARVAAWGGSAGGCLAALCAASGDAPAFAPKASGHTGVSDRVQAAVDWYGPINFLTMDAQFAEIGLDGQRHSVPDSFESRLLGRPITDAPDLVARHNPETYVAPDCPPILIQHGTADEVIPYLQSVAFARHVEAVAGPGRATLELLPGAGHADDRFHADANIARVLDFLDRHIGAPA